MESTVFPFLPYISIPFLHTMVISVLWSPNRSGSPESQDSHCTPKFLKPMPIDHYCILGHVQMQPHCLAIKESKLFCIAEFRPSSFTTSPLFGSSERFYQWQMYVFFRSLIQMLNSTEMLCAQPQWKHSHYIYYCIYNYPLNPIN